MAHHLKPGSINQLTTAMDRKLPKKKITKQRIFLFSLTLLTFVFAVYVSVSGDGKKSLRIDREKILVSTVKYGSFRERIPVTGIFEPVETFLLDVPNGGRVTERFASEGDLLKKGDPIIKLDNLTLRLNLMYNEANVYQAINDLRSTRLSLQQNRLTLQSRLLQIDRDMRAQKRLYEMNAGLYGKGYISKKEYLDSKEEFEYLKKHRNLTLETFRQDSLMRIAQVEQLELQVEQMQTNLKLTREQAENLTVTAPVDGQLTSFRTEIGESISAGENIGKIDKVDSFKVKVEIDEHWITRITAGQEGEFELSGETYPLGIKRIYPEVKEGIFEADMIFKGKMPRKIRRGQTVNVKLALGEQNKALFINRGGFYGNTAGKWIYVLDKNESSAERREITIGRQNSDSYEILTGLKKDEKVIISPYENYGDADILLLN